MKVVITKQFEKDFRSLPEQVKLFAVKAYENILTAKTIYDIHQCRQLKGSVDRYRIRIGAYRILFLFIIKDNTVELRRVVHRGQAYKKNVE
jgi:mRNA-degrading endonuclease RelE of RelBE toxin-antitoxin system